MPCVASFHYRINQRWLTAQVQRKGRKWLYFPSDPTERQGPQAETLVADSMETRHTIFFDLNDCTRSSLLFSHGWRQGQVDIFWQVTFSYVSFYEKKNWWNLSQKTQNNIM